MELSRRDLILALLAVFVAWGYATHWFPALRLVPWAFSAGVLGTVVGGAWIVGSVARGQSGGSGRGKLKGLEEVRIGTAKSRNVAFELPRNWEREMAALKRRSFYKKKSICPDSPVISEKLDGLLELVLRDFVEGWYRNISTRPTFTNEVDRAVRAALTSILEHVQRLDLVEFAVSRVIPILTTHIRDFDDAERAVRGKKLTRNVTESEELDLAIAAKYANGKLHPAASLAYSNPKLVQQQHLRGIVMRLLPSVLPDSMRKSSAVSVLIKEIVACAVLYPVTSLLADPDTWNQMMEGYGRTLLQERKTVKKLRAALDEHASPTPKVSSKFTAFPRLYPEDNERKFERFIRSIRQCNTLSDARRFRSEIASQLRKESEIDDQDQLYLRRLETGKRILDQKIAQLGAGGAEGKIKPRRVKTAKQHTRTRSRLENASLRDVLYSASGLSYFMEYMDRQGLMRLVQFWIVVDGFRNPLEEDTDQPAESSVAWSDSDRNDIAQISEAYLSKPEITVSPQGREDIKQFFKAGSDATPRQYQQARRAVLRAQTAAFEEMRDLHFAAFKKSDLYFKWLASDDAAATIGPTPTMEADFVHEPAAAPTPEITPIRPPKLQHLSTSNIVQKAPDLRRAVASSADLQTFKKPVEKRGSDTESNIRRSLDGGSRTPLFDDDYDTDPLAQSTQSFDSDGETRQNGNDAQIVDAMQAALTDIMDDPGGDRESLFSEPGLKVPQDSDSMRGSTELRRPESPGVSKERVKPSIASLGLIGTPGRRDFFDDDLFGEEEKFLEDEREDSDVNEQVGEDEIHEAAPGDLGLAEAIDSLTGDIEKLVTQESIIDSLMKKAELTNNAAEMRILKKSKASLQREINRKELQRQQYIVQESDNSLYGRATVTIQSIMVGNEEDGKEFAMYIIEVRRRAGEQMPAAAWVVARRYSEFHDLNKRLRAKYPQIRNLEFPRRQMVFKLQKDFLQKRRQALERYLRELLLIPAICRSREFRSFLSQQAISPTSPSSSQADSRDFVTRIFNSVSDGMEEFLGNVPVLDQLHAAGQNLVNAATTQLNNTNAPGGGLAGPSPTTSTTPGSTTANLLASSDPDTAAEAEAELRAFESRELEPFVKPICDLFLELFALNRESNWLRGRAVVVVLHQLLGGTIERKVRENVRALLAEDKVAAYVDTAREMLWPGGKMRVAPPVRTSAEKARSRQEAGVVLATLLPDLAGSVVGRANAGVAGRRVLATFNNERLK
ncbi:hypothetical protein K402DRAFT_444962 [Aulographum hederae CBS 113979]|uniref:Intermediate filament protein-like protein n=1 Tax=Aulographum hederae CBS 113979 TaxID=1176131 RepID=A0A6G1H910_9PEZI|nr:hypothetical protein K402DRAFT_444962 [Aulographum hederae CBS 113979]